VGAQPTNLMQEVALSYQQFQRQSDSSNALSLDDWISSHSGEQEAAVGLFRDMHRCDPNAARRLANAVTAMPQIGDAIAGFQLVDELGRGAFAKVFLAKQGDLAGRHVVLKVTAHTRPESQTLAQLQHTNIVPIY